MHNEEPSGSSDIEYQSGFLQLMQKPSPTKLFMVHRLDKATSGLVIFAKSASAARVFGQLFEQKQVEKTYIALANAKPLKKQGWVKGDMKKSRNGSWMLTRSKNNPAITYFKSSACQMNNAALRIFILTPKTGKTHQLRVALKALGAPILGDTRYKGKPADRLYLHAYKLSFIYNDEPYQFEYLPDNGQYFDSNELNNVIEPLLTEK